MCACPVVKSCTRSRPHTPIWRSLLTSETQTIEEVNSWAPWSKSCKDQNNNLFASDPTSNAEQEGLKQSECLVLYFVIDLFLCFRLQLQWYGFHFMVSNRIGIGRIKHFVKDSIIWFYFGRNGILFPLRLLPDSTSSENWALFEETKNKCVDLNPLFCRKVKGDKGNVAAKGKPFKAPLVPRPSVPELPMYSKFPLLGPWCNISRVDGKVIFRASIFILE